MRLLCPVCGAETNVGEKNGFACEACGQWLRCEPYGKAWMLQPAVRELPGEAEAKKLVLRSDNETDPYKRKKYLDEALRLCPDSLEVNRAVLLFGRLGEKTKGIDFHRFKCYLLHMFDEPDEEPVPMREAAVRELTSDPQLLRCLELAPDRGIFINEYCEALCREYLGIFIKGNNRYNGNCLGFRIGKLEKMAAVPVARMLMNMKGYPLPAPYDTCLPAALRKAFEVEIG